MPVIKGKEVKRPARREADFVVSVEQMVKMVSPNGEPFDWFAGAPDAKSTVHIKDGKYRDDLSDKASRFGGRLYEGGVSGLKVVSYDGKTGGVFVEGKGEYEVDGAVMSLSGDSVGIGGPSTGAAVKYGGSLTLRGAIIDTWGLTHYATVAERNSVLRVYDSVLNSHGAPFGEGYVQPTRMMQTPPPPLEIEGNGRTHCTMTNSLSYFYNTTIICDGWAALSTETAEGFVYLEANDCNVVTTKSGYGAYADPGCHVVFKGCAIDSACMAAIIAGQSEMRFYDTDSECGTYFALMHCVNGVPEEVSELSVTGGSIRCKKEIVFNKTDNAIITFDGVDMVSEAGVIVRTAVNEDSFATPVGDDPFGVEVNLKNGDYSGDILHGDTARKMWLTIESATLNGVIKNACLKMPLGSRWTAAGDSEVTLMGDIESSQLDAPEGVTILAHGARAGEYRLQSGGKLIVTE